LKIQNYKIEKIKSSLYSLNTLWSVTSELYPSPQLCSGPTHQDCCDDESFGNVWEIWSALKLNPIPFPLEADVLPLAPSGG